MRVIIKDALIGSTMSCADPSLQKAVHTLYEDHHSWLCGWLRGKLGCMEHAADLAQDTFIRVLTLRKAAELQQPRAYLSSVARSLMIDMFRRRALEQAYLETLAARPEPVAVSPEARLLIIETLLEIDRLLDGLGTRTREVFLMAQARWPELCGNRAAAGCFAHYREKACSAGADPLPDAGRGVSDGGG
ncbi:hypothetical protein DBADOPDK_03885 [Pseudomonas sp. MM223]|nr:hypothetical protein DBADOPDK_03885 [Pseudomonas sp. MM223]